MVKVINLAQQLCVCCLLFVSSGSMGSRYPQVQVETTKFARVLY